MMNAEGKSPPSSPWPLPARRDHAADPPPGQVQMTPAGMQVAIGAQTATVDLLLELATRSCRSSRTRIKASREQRGASQGAESERSERHGDWRITCAAAPAQADRRRPLLRPDQGTTDRRPYPRDLVQTRIAAAARLDHPAQGLCSPGAATDARRASPARSRLAFPRPLPIADRSGSPQRERFPAFLRPPPVADRRTATELLENACTPPRPGPPIQPSPSDSPTPSWPCEPSSTASSATSRPERSSAAARLGEHPDGGFFTSLPRSGFRSAPPQLLTHRPQLPPSLRAPKLPSPPSPESLPWPRNSARTQVGTYPVPVGFRYKRVRPSVTALADNSSRHASPSAARVYAGAITKPQGPPARHPHPGPRLDPASSAAARLDGLPYDPARRGLPRSAARQPARPA